jgi:hypothetical protein
MSLTVRLVTVPHWEPSRERGIGPFTGCAAGDTGAAVVLRVEE